MKKYSLGFSVLFLSLPFAALAQSLTIESNILGLCDTGNKTTLKKELVYTHGPGDIHLYHYDAEGRRVVYENEKSQHITLDPVKYQGQAVLILGNVDDKLIDSSEARVTLLDGNTYYADEFILKADKLSGEWHNGQCVYTLSEGDIEFNTWGYDTTTDFNSGREWSIMGGDGNGVYAFTLQVSGIRYAGREVPAATFPVAVYCYGRSCTDLASRTEFVENGYDAAYQSGLAPAEQVQWKWFTEGEQSAVDKPYMNDLFTDYFTLVWPKGTDASQVKAGNVKVTLRSPFGDSYVLSEQTAYGEHEYAVISHATETTVCVRYQQWAPAPRFTTLTIEVSKGGDIESKTYDISSVSASMTQTGGGGVDVDHTLTCYNYHGLANMNMDNAVNKYYTLSVERDGQTYYYAEDAEGKGYLSAGVKKQGFGGMGGPGGPRRASAPADAWKGDGTDIYHIAVLGNVVFVETRMDTPGQTVTTEVKEVDGEKITFKRNLQATRNAQDMVRHGATLEPGYNLARGGAHQWAWTQRYQSGWTTSDVQPTDLPYVEGAYPYGYRPGSANPVYNNKTK